MIYVTILINNLITSKSLSLSLSEISITSPNCCRIGAGLPVSIFLDGSLLLFSIVQLDESKHLAIFLPLTFITVVLLPKNDLFLKLLKSGGALVALDSGVVIPSCISDRFFLALEGPSEIHNINRQYYALVIGT